MMHDWAGATQCGHTSIRECVVAEIGRLRDDQVRRDLADTPWWMFRRRAWLNGVQIARDVAADRLDEVIDRFDEPVPMAQHGDGLCGEFTPDGSIPRGVATTNFCIWVSGHPGPHSWEQ